MVQRDVSARTKINETTLKGVEHGIKVCGGPKQQYLQENDRAETDPQLFWINAGHSDDEATKDGKRHQEDDLRACDGYEEIFDQGFESPLLCTAPARFNVSVSPWHGRTQYSPTRSFGVTIPAVAL